MSAADLGPEPEPQASRPAPQAEVTLLRPPIITTCPRHGDVRVMFSLECAGLVALVDLELVPLPDNGRTNTVRPPMVVTGAVQWAEVVQ